jgi:hypothetical protein
VYTCLTSGQEAVTVLDYAKFDPLALDAKVTDLRDALQASFGDPDLTLNGRYDDLRFGKKGLHGFLENIITVLDRFPVSNPDHDAYVKLFTMYLPKITRMVISYRTATTSSKFNKAHFDAGGQFNQSTPQAAAGEF